MKKKTRKGSQEPVRTKSRKGMRKPAKMMRCALLIGSAWSTEKEVHEVVQRHIRHLLWIEHRLRKEEMEEQLNKEVCSRRGEDHRRECKQGRKHALGGVFMAFDSNLGVVIDKEEGAVMSEEVRRFLSCILATQKTGHRGMRRCCKGNENHQASLAGGL